MIDDEAVDDFLEHHGVHGVKRDQRKEQKNHGLNSRAAVVVESMFGVKGAQFTHKMLQKDRTRTADFLKK